VLAAFGLLAAAIEHHHARTCEGLVDDIDLGAVNRCLDELNAAGQARMREEGVSPAAVDVVYSADMRYAGQAYEVEGPSAAPLTPERVRDGRESFHAAHERVYGYARLQQPVEFVNFRAVHRHPLPRPVVRPAQRAAGALSDARIDERRAYFVSGGWVKTAI